jgi:hypothetical protein
VPLNGDVGRLSSCDRVIVNLNVVAEALQPRSVAWLSLQSDGSISVGLTDRTFVSPTFQARNFVWNLYNRVELEYIVAHTPEALEPVPNPHLTFHPPIYFHLRANGQEELWAGIAEPRLMLRSRLAVCAISCSILIGVSTPISSCLSWPARTMPTWFLSWRKRILTSSRRSFRAGRRRATI